MTPNEYLVKILEEQTFDEGDRELNDLRERRDSVRDLLISRFKDSNPSIRWAGSMAKSTMVRTAYDGDITCYFEYDEVEAGDTLEALYVAVEGVLGGDYVVERKPSALRIRNRDGNSLYVDLHLDVVPGRFIDEDKKDVFLHRTTGGKERLKTNLDVHIDHVRKSGVRKAIRLLKVWNVRHGIGAKTFILELLVVKLLEERKADSLADQLEHVWTEMRDHAGELAIEDPANPSGNDLKPALDECRYHLSMLAGSALANVRAENWAAIFGSIEDDNNNEDDGDVGQGRTTALKAAALSTPRASKPWRKQKGDPGIWPVQISFPRFGPTWRTDIPHFISSWRRTGPRFAEPIRCFPPQARSSSDSRFVSISHPNTPKISLLFGRQGAGFLVPNGTMSTWMELAAFLYRIVDGRRSPSALASDISWRVRCATTF